MINKELQTHSKEINRRKILHATLYYLKNYLNPDEKWDKRITPKERINKIRYAEVHWETVSDYIKDMDYRHFLKTPYWKAIAAHTKYRAGYRCQLCNSAYNLVTHHRSYKIHGREHAHMHELIVLCNNCHSKFHDKIPKPQFRAKSISESNPKARKSLAILILFSIIFLLLSTFEGRKTGNSGFGFANRRSFRKRR